MQRVRLAFLPAAACLVLPVAMPSVACADCIDDAAAYRHINVQLVRAIAQQESGMRANAVNRNANGSEDLGLMQINTTWLPKLARFGIRREHLFNACVNAYVGTWILASNIQKFGANWKAVGAYNSPTTAHQIVYANSIYRRLQGH